MKILPFIFFILLVGKATASSLPNCPSAENPMWHNCFGIITTKGGDKYVGEWNDNERHGQGTYTWKNGDKYVGEWKDHKRNGQGTYTWDEGPSKGDKYVGEFKDNIKHGQGTYTYANGDKFVGEYKDNAPHGQGTYTYANGTIKSGYYMKGEYVPYICSSMGLIEGSESFGQCVLKLIDKIDE